ncbi:hypothetical protein BGZ70_000245 [Mortierella alpina]|uniref:Uncharacterized protein n=1 Tax=Mortierella alpina TaxID=64518 RepID=A0A9P6LZ94_MORAP|nr:hypothetical protein BGZ70_000245 [Mortierella alpina]
MSPEAACQNYPRRMPQAIFLDSGGVINDNSRRAPQWVYHLEQYMPTTRLGGPGKLWGEANAILSDQLFGSEDRLWDKFIAESEDFKSFYRTYCLYWMNGTIGLVNDFLRREHEQNIALQDQVAGSTEKEPLQLAYPETEAELIEIAHNAHLYCTALVQADYPGAVEAIMRLKFEQGFDMYTCSGEAANELELTFRTLGISTLSPSAAASTEHILAWAKIHGARTVLISDKNRKGKEMMIEVEEVDEENGKLKKKMVPVVDHQLESLAQLPDLTASWKNSR